MERCDGHGRFFLFFVFLLLNFITIIIDLPLSQIVNNQKRIIINISNII